MGKYCSCGIQEEQIDDLNEDQDSLEDVRERERRLNEIGSDYIENRSKIRSVEEIGFEREVVAPLTPPESLPQLSAQMLRINEDAEKFYHPDADPQVYLNGSEERGVAWQEYIDSVHHKFGEDCYDEGKHRSGSDYKEPGYLQSMMNARAKVKSQLNVVYSSVNYKELHDIVKGHNPAQQDWRGAKDDAVTYGVPQSLNDMNPNPGFYTLDMQPVALENAELRKCNGPAEMNLAMTRAGARLDVQKGRGVQLLAVDDVSQDVDVILEQYYSEIDGAKSPAAKLVAIARVEQRLERLHPFKDGNTRMNTLMLNKFLLENGFPPVILEDPNVSYFKSPEDWAEDILRGMDQWARSNDIVF